jgi:hypothetical protein
MRRFVILSAVLLAGAVAAAQQPTFVTNKNATLVMKNGDRQSGTLVYHNDANFNLIQNGKEQAYPIDQVALVDLVGGGAPSTAELTHLPTSPDPPELQRHMLVLRDGTALKGKMYTIKENAITFDTEQGQRRDFDLSNIARLYVSAPGARQLYAAQLAQPAGAVATAGQAAPPGSFTVNAASGWVDTGRTVRRGQQLTFQSTGEIHFGADPSQVSEPNGKADPSQPTLPLPSAGVGAVIGRIGNGQPFLIGAGGPPVTMTGNGRLYIGINDRELGDNSGAFAVVIR